MSKTFTVPEAVIQSALGIKRAQFDGVRKSDMSREVDQSVNGEGVLDLARAVLKRRGAKALASSGEAAAQ